MENRVYNKIVNICIGVAIVAVLLFGRAAAAGQWIAVSLIAAASLVSVCAYFLAISNESKALGADARSEHDALLAVEDFPLAAVGPEFKQSNRDAYYDLGRSFAAQGFSEMARVRVSYLLRRQEMFLRLHNEVLLREEMLLQPEHFNHLCSLLLSEASWYAKDSAPIAETIERLTRAEAEMELIVISKAPSGTIFFKIRNSGSSRSKGTRPSRPRIVDQVVDWVDATSSVPA